MHRTRHLRLLTSLGADCSGGAAVLLALSLSTLLGMLALSTEVAEWYVVKTLMRTTADAAASSAATAKAGGAGTLAALQTQADAVAAQNGFVAGSGTTVILNNPPASGPYTTNQNAVEVIIRQKQNRLLVSLFLASNPTVAARSVALAKPGACVIALASSGTAISTGGSSSIDLSNCDLYSNSDVSIGVASSITATDASLSTACPVSGFTITGVEKCNTSLLTRDPYANYAVPSFTPCTKMSSYTARGSSDTISAGVYCGDIKVPPSKSLTLNPGIYWIDQGSLTVKGTLSGSGVTIILTSSTGSNYGTVDFGGSSQVNLTPMVTGSTRGIAVWVDKDAPSNTNYATGGANQFIDGAIYMPSQTLNYSGNASTGGCRQLVASAISITGFTSLTHDCGGSGVQEPGPLAQLVE